jgi:sodium/potassium/calcium exchanger 6
LGALLDRLIAAAGAAGGLVSLAAAAARWVERPLALARAATIPVVTDGEERREGGASGSEPGRDPWLPVALCLGPVAGLAYLGAPWVALAVAGAVGAAAAAATAAPNLSTARLPPALARAALTLTSAALALAWVDATATALVGALQLLTTLSRVPPALAGGTLLAWGNSAGDAAANVAIARRGLPNMALTACFAGPATNLLLGLGSGLLAGVRGRAAAGKGASIPTRLGPGGRAATAFVWAMVGVVLGCALACGQRLPRKAAAVLGGVYAAYMVVGVSIAATDGAHG